MNTEQDVMNLCRMRAQELGCVLWRNNNGALLDRRGIPVRFGLANDSKKINEVFKSSDVIGIAWHGRFFAVECKEPFWRWGGTDEERAQLAFICDVRERGGFAGFACHPDHVSLILISGYGAYQL